MGKEEISKLSNYQLGYLWGRTFGRIADVYLHEILKRAFSREKKK